MTIVTLVKPSFRRSDFLALVTMKVSLVLTFLAVAKSTVSITVDRSELTQIDGLNRLKERAPRNHNDGQHGCEDMESASTTTFNAVKPSYAFSVSRRVNTTLTSIASIIVSKATATMPSEPASTTRREPSPSTQTSAISYISETLSEITTTNRGSFASTTSTTILSSLVSLNNSGYGNSSSTTVPASMSSETGSPPTSLWKPAVGSSFQIVLSKVVNPVAITPDVDAFEIDLFDTPVDTISSLKEQGKKVICYFSAGTADNWRPDYNEFLPSDMGNPMTGWPGQTWVNITDPAGVSGILSNVWNIMLARIQLAASKGCDAIDPDNVGQYKAIRAIKIN